jgi:hypothetical protein
MAPSQCSQLQVDSSFISDEALKTQFNMPSETTPLAAQKEKSRSVQQSGLIDVISTIGLCEDMCAHATAMSEDLPEQQPPTTTTPDDT